MSDSVTELSDAEANHLGNASTAEELKLVEDELEQIGEQVEYLLQRQQELQSRRDELRQVVETDKRAPKADWSGIFDWDDRATTQLRDVFKLQSFRPQQKAVINATMQGRDVLCLMPSGGGKSLCYQLPALLSGGCTIVISPLLSLIEDQVLGLRENNVRVTSLTSLTSKEEQSDIYKMIDSDTSLRLIYVTPERVVNVKRFMTKLDKLHKAGRLKRIAIDEAHCCSQWGNDFRPDYKKLGFLKQQFQGVPILALTATATERAGNLRGSVPNKRVCSDLKAILRIPDCEVFESSVNRANLFYEVRWKPADVIGDMMAWMEEHFESDESGIVYCLTRKDAETVSQLLNVAGMSAGFYHADMDPSIRQSVHQSWSKRQLRVIVATVAFGMGINKPDVRFVIHHSLSKSIENYYQESARLGFNLYEVSELLCGLAGRAGRDGLPARCLLYYRPADVMRQAALVVTEPGWDVHLFAMMRQAESNAGCRRSVMARHFAEAPPPCRGTCDLCDRPQKAVRVDVTAEAKAVVDTLQAVPSAEKRLTLIQLIHRWRTSKLEEDRELARGATKDANEQLIGQLLVQGILQLDFGFTAYATNTYLKVSQRGLQGEIIIVFAGKKQVFMHRLAEVSEEGSPLSKKLKRSHQGLSAD